MNVVRANGSQNERFGGGSSMSSAKATVDLNVSPGELWQLIGGFGSLPDWIPGLTQSKLADGGRVRYLHDPQGHTFVEQLEHYDSSARSYSYSILQSPLSISDYLSTITVTPTNGGRRSHVEWSGSFMPLKISEKEAQDIFQGLYSAGLTALASRYTGKPQ
jgi:hypothetical protein